MVCLSPLDKAPGLSWGSPPCVGRKAGFKDSNFLVRPCSVLRTLWPQDFRVEKECFQEPCTPKQRMELVPELAFLGCPQQCPGLGEGWLLEWLTPDCPLPCFLWVGGWFLLCMYITGEGQVPPICLFPKQESEKTLVLDLVPQRGLCPIECRGDSSLEIQNI